MQLNKQDLLAMFKPGIVLYLLKCPELVVRILRYALEN